MPAREVGISGGMGWALAGWWSVIGAPFGESFHSRLLPHLFDQHLQIGWADAKTANTWQHMTAHTRPQLTDPVQVLGAWLAQETDAGGFRPHAQHQSGCEQPDPRIDCLVRATRGGGKHSDPHRASMRREQVWQRAARREISPFVHD